MAVSLYPLATSAVKIGGVAVVAAFGPFVGGFIQNPLRPNDQGLNVAEPLLIDLVTSAGVKVSATTVSLPPGAAYFFPANDNVNVSVNAASSGHKFSGIVTQPPTQFPPTPQAGNFPPSVPTALANIIPSYLYQQYSDDSDLQAFVSTYNALGQQYVTWFNTINLPIYTGNLITGSLLDWVANGLYGIVRPSLASGRNRNIGAFNTYTFNSIAFNAFKKIGPQNISVTSDDIFKRVITWEYFKGDGKYVSIRWIKRRIIRFLYGVNGTNFNADQTYRVSITFGIGNQVNITITQGKRTVTKSLAFNKSTFNSLPFNGIKSTYVAYPLIPNTAILEEALNAGVLELPFQYQYVVNV